MPGYATRVRRFSLEEAVAILDAVGCSTDPIVLLSPKPGGIGFDEVSCPNDLLYYIDYAKVATSIRIEYYGGPKCEAIRGTLQKMVMDRMRRE